MRGNNLLPGRSGVATTLLRGVALTVRGVAFWTAALLPFLYVPLVLVDHAAIANASLLGKLVALNIAALLVGHGHGTAVRGEFEQ